MKIELKPHFGIHCANRKEIDTGQDRIHVDGQHVGYVHRRIDSPITLIVRDLDVETKQTIQLAVLEKYGGEQRVVGEPIEIPTEELESDLDEEQEVDQYDE